MDFLHCPDVAIDNYIHVCSNIHQWRAAHVRYTIMHLSILTGRGYVCGHGYLCEPHNSSSNNNIEDDGSAYLAVIIITKANMLDTH